MIHPSQQDILAAGSTAAEILQSVKEVKARLAGKRGKEPLQLEKPIVVTPIMVPSNQITRRKKTETELTIDGLRLLVDQLMAERDHWREKASEYSRTLMHYVVKDEDRDNEQGVVHDRPSMRSICNEVLKSYPATLDEVLGARRTAHLVDARIACMVAVKEQRPDLSYPVIGRFFNRDHTTILHHIRKAQGDPLKGKDGPR